MANYQLAEAAEADLRSIADLQGFLGASRCGHGSAIIFL